MGASLGVACEVDTAQGGTELAFEDQALSDVGSAAEALCFRIAYGLETSQIARGEARAI